MTKILVLYYSMYGHIETLAQAVADGVRENGAIVALKRVPELMPEEVARNAGAKLDQAAPFATPTELAGYDAIIIGTPTRFGNMAAQMRNFLDQTGGLWMKGALSGKIGSVFTCTATGAGTESTILTVFNTFIHHGMIIMGLDPSTPELFKVGELRGGSIYGAGSITGPDGSRMPSAAELSLAHAQGARVARFAAKLKS